jgi:ABC-type bacteriocin/lantibiotic exporter with double-glycine peptidase domain
VRAGKNIEQKIERRRLLAAWRYHWSLYAPTRGRVVLAIVAAVGQSLVLLPVPLLIGYLLDSATRTRRLDGILWVGAAILALQLLHGAGSLLTRYLVVAADTNAIKRMRVQLVEKCYGLSRGYFSRADHNQLYSTIVHDSDRVAVMSGVLIDQFLPALISAGAISLILIWLYKWLALVVVVVAPVMYLSLQLLGRRVKRVQGSYRESFGDFSRHVNQSLQHMTLTQESGAEAFALARLSAKIDNLLVATRRVALLLGKYSVGHNTVVAVSGTLVLVIGGGGVVSGYLTPGELLAAYAAFTLLRTQVATLSRVFPQIAAGSVSLLALQDMLRIDDPPPYTGTLQIRFAGHVILEDISFRYSEELVLRDVSIEIKPGAQVALVGESGAGKSTVANLILGFYKPERGRILLDGHRLEDLDLTHLRRQIGVVPQDPIIMAGTIAENIAFDVHEVTPQQLAEAARLSGIHEFIMSLPKGYESYVGENGMLLSGGQRQRIAIARALVRRPRLLILDEPTNHLDATAISHLMESLRRLAPAPAMLIISHDLKVVGETESVYLLKRGSITERNSR